MVRVTAVPIDVIYQPTKSGTTFLENPVYGNHFNNQNSKFLKKKLGKNKYFYKINVNTASRFMGFILELIEGIK